MKALFLCIICLISNYYVQVPENYFRDLETIIPEEKQAFLDRFQTKNITNASGNFDIKYYRCQWQVDPAVRFIAGEVTSYFIITTAANSISFDLTDSLVVDSVKQYGNPLTFIHANNTVTLTFGNTDPRGKLDSVSIYYHGVPPNAGFGSFVASSHAGTPVMWTLSEPYGSRDWWPCKNGLDDKADSIDVFITCPSAYSAVSNGLRQDQIINGTSVTTHWKHRYPIASYLVCMAVTNYTEYTDSVKVGNISLPVETFCYPESLTLFKNNTFLVLGDIRYYDSLIGNYPFVKEKYGQVQFGWGGGQEHQTSTFIVTPNENLMAHELAHHWFGDKITCGSWHDIWLNEGFATHLAIMDFEMRYPLSVTDNRKKEIALITSVPNGSVYVYDTTNVNRIFDSRLTYYKGSHVLYMLRWILGDSIFIKGLRRYFNDSTISFGFARTDDFERNMEAASGKDLGYFFKEWIYGQGYPTYTVKWTPIGNDYVKINMTQTTSDTSVSFFELPVALEFKNATQQKTIIVNNTFNNQTFFNHIGFVPDTVLIDPDYWLISANNVSQKVSDEIAAENVVQVFPNPFTYSFSIYLHNFKSSKVNLRIFDLKGGLLYQEELSVDNALYKEINCGNLPRSIYILNIATSDGFNFSKKILKQ